MQIMLVDVIKSEQDTLFVYNLILAHFTVLLYFEP